MTETTSIGAFSVSLAVKDLEKSKAFYEGLGFEAFAGGADQNYYILKNGVALIGIFHGMFENNILTFNPGWDQGASELASYEDVRAMKARLAKSGHVPPGTPELPENGPANFVMMDPDGNAILIDQHVG